MTDLGAPGGWVPATELTPPLRDALPLCEQLVNSFDADEFDDRRSVTALACLLEPAV
jgi:hypothetical protein